MNSQFILIDHSIVNTDGHYFEYARRVLGAAKASGFRTILVINQRAKGIECPEADLIMRLFSKTFWENQSLSKLRVVKSFILKNDLIPIQLDYAKKFAEELVTLMNQGAVSENDLVFIPTLGGTELMGVSLYSASSAAVSVSWHMLFRRDIPFPKNWFDVRNRILRWKTKASFTYANAFFQNGFRYFYTDTENLTQQYKALGVGEFKTLPIPIDSRLGYKKLWHQGPLVVSYLGDLRDEKGIHLLPKIIQSLRNDGFDASQVVFRIQANFSNAAITRSEVRAKRSLMSKKLCGVELIDGPLSSSAYQDLLLGSDIVLLPYSTTNYVARSSGVFAEAVAAGVPTIHPRCSWMGRNAAILSNSGYIKVANIADELKAVLREYKRHEAASLEFCKKWRTKHSAQKLVQMLGANCQEKNY